MTLDDAGRLLIRAQDCILFADRRPPSAPLRLEGGPLVPRLREVAKHDSDAEIVQSMYRQMFGDRDPVAEPGTATGTPATGGPCSRSFPTCSVTRCADLRCTAARSGSSTPCCASWARPAPAGPEAASSSSPSTASRAARSGCLGGADRGDRSLAGRHLFHARRALRARLHRCARLRRRTRRRRRVRRASSTSVGRGDPRVDVHHDDVRDARGDVAALRLEWDDRPEPNVEVASPEGAEARDIGADIAGPES